MRVYTKKDVVNLIHHKDYKKLIPFVATDFEGIFKQYELEDLIKDQESGFFKTYIMILSEYLDELEDYYDEHDVEYSIFFDICDMFSNTIKQSLALSIMTDPSVNNYSALNKNGFLLNFDFEEILEILESFDAKQCEAFLNSVNHAINQFMLYGGYDKSEQFLYLVELGQYLPKAFKDIMVQAIISSKPESVSFEDEIIRKQWDLPLNLETIAWLCDLEEIHYQKLIEHIKKNFKDKQIEQDTKPRFRVLLRMLRMRLQEFQEYPIESLSMTKAQIREFLTRLAGVEGCRYTPLEWQCGGKEFTYSKKILSLMKIPIKTQQTFFKLSKEFGGYCDCEILMNAASRLLKEETPW
jgi:hypothetical protein